MLNIRASLLIVYSKVTINKFWLQTRQNTTINELLYFLNHKKPRGKKMMIIRYVCVKNDKIMHRRLRL